VLNRKIRSLPGLGLGFLFCLSAYPGLASDPAFVEQGVIERSAAGAAVPVLVISRNGVVSLPVEGDLEAAINATGPGRTVDAFRDILRSDAPFYAPSSEKGVAAAILTQDGLAILRKDSDIAAIIANGTMTISASPLPGVGQVEQAHTHKTFGKGVTIAVIDTGVQGSHPYLAGAVIGELCSSFSAPKQGYLSLCPQDKLFVQGKGAAEACQPAHDGCEHGTHVAGIVAGRSIKLENGAEISGVAPAASIYAVKAGFLRKDANGKLVHYFDDYSVINALNHIAKVAEKYNIVAINYSASTDEVFPANCDRSKGNADLSRRYGAVIKRLRDKGISFIVAAGNGGRDNGIGRPACLSNAVAVGALNEDGTAPAPFSDSSIKVDFMAPGTNIVSSVTDGVFSAKDGTSMAAPFMAGVIALMRERVPPADASIDGLLAALRSTSSPVIDQRNGLRFPVPEVEAAISAIISGKSGGSAASGADGGPPPRPAETDDSQAVFGQDTEAGASAAPSDDPLKELAPGQSLKIQ
jgi:Subtilase family